MEMIDFHIIKNLPEIQRVIIHDTLRLEDKNYEN
jgi:hypothetical protein